MADLNISSFVLIDLDPDTNDPSGLTVGITGDTIVSSVLPRNVRNVVSAVEDTSATWNEGGEPSAVGFDNWNSTLDTVSSTTDGSAFWVSAYNYSVSSWETVTTASGGWDEGGEPSAVGYGDWNEAFGYVSYGSGTLGDTSATVKSLSGTTLAISGTTREVSGYVFNSSGNIGDTSATVESLSGTTLAISGTTREVSGYVFNSSGNIGDTSASLESLSGTTIAISGTTLEVSGYVFNSSGNIGGVSGSVNDGSSNWNSTHTDVYDISSLRNRVLNWILDGSTSLYQTSGYVYTSSGNIGDTSATVKSLSGTTLAISGTTLEVSGYVFNSSGTLGDTSATVESLSGTTLAISGTTLEVSGYVYNSSGNIGDTSASVESISGTTLAISGTTLEVSGYVFNSSGNIGDTSATVESLSGTVATSATAYITGSNPTASVSAITVSSCPVPAPWSFVAITDDDGTEMSDPYYFGYTSTFSTLELLPSEITWKSFPNIDSADMSGFYIANAGYYEFEMIASVNVGSSPTTITLEIISTLGYDLVETSYIEIVQTIRTNMDPHLGVVKWIGYVTAGKTITAKIDGTGAVATKKGSTFSCKRLI